MTYQNVTGPLMASGYQKLGTQEAMNDMYIVGGGSMNTNWDGTQVSPTLTKNNAGGGQRMPDKDNFNCVIGERPARGINGDIAGTLDSNYYKGCGERQGIEGEVVESEMDNNTAVRRLTPKECERLQGYPDGWTDIGEWVDSNGKKHKDADSPRYKALGNSIALPFWFYLLRRISAQYERPATLGSLFDGIGGFPLCWVRCNGSDSVKWTSEIEEFPMAVTKKHFGDEENGVEGDIKEYL